MIKAIIVVSKIKFRPEYYIRSLHHINLKNPIKSIRESFKIYYPVIRSIDNEDLQEKIKKNIGDSSYIQELYTSSINFWSDMVEIAKEVDHSKDKEFKLEWIQDKLSSMNKHLPSFVFIPSESNLLFFSKFLIFFFRRKNPLYDRDEYRDRGNKNLPNQN